MPELRPLVGDCEAITGPSPCMASPLFCSWLAFSLQAGCLAIFLHQAAVTLLKLGQLQSWVHGPDWPPSPPAATKDRQVLCKICLNTCLGIFFYFPPLFCSEYLCWSNGMSICHTCFCAWQLALHQLAKYIYQCSKVAGFFRRKKIKCSSRMRGVMY